jgi:hypothetical protein
MTPRSADEWADEAVRWWQAQRDGDAPDPDPDHIAVWPDAGVVLIDVGDDLHVVLDSAPTWEWRVLDGYYAGAG